MLWWIALFYLSPIFALDCSLTESLESLDPIEYVKGYKALGYPFWVKSENRISVLSKHEKKFKTALAPTDFDIAFTKIKKIFDSAGIRRQQNNSLTI
jgi:hypothetical protein